MLCVVIYYSHIVHLMAIEISLIIIEVRFVLKKNMTGFVILGPKTHSYLIDDYTEEKS